MGVILLNNYDLIHHWRAIHARMDRLRDQAVRARQRAESLGTCYKLAIDQLLAEMVDFFQQLDQVDTYMSMVIDSLTVGWLLSIAGLFYFAQLNATSMLPIDVFGIMVLILVLMCVCFLIILQLQRECARSYATFCTLLAYDNPARIVIYELVLELFGRHKYCFTIFRNSPFKTTTILSMFAYSGSSFFLIASLFRNRQPTYPNICNEPLDLGLFRN